MARMGYTCWPRLRNYTENAGPARNILKNPLSRIAPNGMTPEGQRLM
jgi:hypothetical protein